MSMDFYQPTTGPGIPTAQLVELYTKSKQLETTQVTKTKQASLYSISRFHEMCQKRGITVKYRDYERKTQTGPQFKATVDLEQLGVFDTGDKAYSSKKFAKDAVARLAYASLTGISVEDVGEVPTARPAEEVKKVERAEKIEDKDGNVVYASRLNTYMSMRKIDPPVYTYVQVGLAQFVCRLGVTGRDEPFVSAEWSSKRKAREQVAKEACTEFGILDVDPVTTQFGDQILDNWPKKVDDMCKKLKIPPPTYQLTPNPAALLFFTGSAFFPPTAPRALRAVDGIGSISWLPSKKDAKAAICINVLQELEALRPGDY